VCYLVGWIVTFRVLGDVFDIKFFLILNFISTILLFLTWIVLFSLTVVAFWKGLIFKSSDEDFLDDWQVSRDEKVDMNQLP
jgi:hypothetical protein